MYDILRPARLESAMTDENKVLYGVPLAPSHIPRLAAVSRLLGPQSVGVFIDHPDQLQSLLNTDTTVWPGRIPIFIKIDTGSHRAGLSAESPGLVSIADNLARHNERLDLVGTYAHAGHSYACNSPQDAMNYLGDELESTVAATEVLLKHLPATQQPLTISIGATPTATSTQTLLRTMSAASPMRQYLEKIQSRFHVEIHAGVYSLLDMQQMATGARASWVGTERQLHMDSIGLRIMVEVASVYNDREKPEALICAGSVVLGREPCKSYSGWGVVTPWRTPGGSESVPEYQARAGGDGEGWIVGRVSQEHGMLTWEGTQALQHQLRVGEKLMIWPNHACIAGSNIGWYLVIDSEKGEKDVVTDVWVRSRGW